MIQYIPALIIGFAFGWLLQKAGLTRYSKIVNVFRFTDMAVLKFMMAALVVGMIGVYALRDLGLVTLVGTMPTYIVGNLVGGLIFGVGMAGAGYCPGTCAAGGGQGNVDYIVPGFLGFLVGAILFGLTYPAVFPAISGIANLGAVYLPDLLNVNHWLLIALFTLVTLFLFYVLNKKGEPRRDQAAK